MWLFVICFTLIRSVAVWAGVAVLSGLVAWGILIHNETHFESIDMPVSSDALLSAHDRTMNDIAFALTEFHHELSPDSYAKVSHRLGVSFTLARAEARYEEIVGKNTRIANDPRPVLRAALKFLEGGDDEVAIRRAMIVLEGYFSTFGGRESINFDVNDASLADSDRVVINTALIDFIEFVKRNIENVELDDLEESDARARGERCCDLARRVTYVLYPYWDAYHKNASASELEYVALFGKALQSELVYNETLLKSFGDATQHVSDVIASTKRRQRMFAALESGSQSDLEQAILDELELSESKFKYQRLGSQ